MRIGIVGYGVVGKHLHQLFSSVADLIVPFDKVSLPGVTTKEEINTCDLVFVAVPTPALPDGACDLGAIEEVVTWIEPPICIKSTIVPGTIDRLVSTTGKKIVFSPEYVGETVFHKYKNTFEADLVAIGGDAETCERFLNLYRSALGPQPQYFQTDAVTAELAKYMENCFFATKVAFVAEFFLLAQHFGANFTQLREIWVADTRIGRSHSTVVGSLGFSGRCLPKDLSAIISSATTTTGSRPMLLEAVNKFNKSLRISEQA
jgi:UDPglucose 6-dehydrogenase